MPRVLRCRLVRIMSDTSTRTSRYADIAIRCPRYNRDTEGGKTFLVTAAILWNSLPLNIRSSTSITAFKQNYCNFIKDGYAGFITFPFHNSFIIVWSLFNITFNITFSIRRFHFRYAFFIVVVEWGLNHSEQRKWTTWKKLSLSFAIPNAGFALLHIERKVNHEKRWNHI